MIKVISGGRILLSCNHYSPRNEDGIYKPSNISCMRTYCKDKLGDKWYLVGGGGLFHCVGYNNEVRYNDAFENRKEIEPFFKLTVENILEDISKELKSDKLVSKLSKTKSMTINSFDGWGEWEAWD